jgi:hypothetical protein
MPDFTISFTLEADSALALAPLMVKFLKDNYPNMQVMTPVPHPGRVTIKAISPLKSLQVIIRQEKG